VRCEGLSDEDEREVNSRMIKKKEPKLLLIFLG
jgi:hypothetical protein